MKEKYSQKLLVEGNDDRHIIWSLCQKFNVPENFDVIDCDGIDNIFAQLPIRIKQSGIKTIGIMVDADFDIQKRWQKLYDALKKLGYKIDNVVNSEGVILSQDNMPRLGIWIMPDNKVSGMLEDFIEFLIPDNDKLITIAKEVLDKIENEKINQYQTIHRSKALISTWLSWQEDPGTPMGLAITKKYLSTEQKICIKFIEWVTVLYKTDK
jgi:hypothetical protein